jgi:hypothetical protein
MFLYIFIINLLLYAFLLKIFFIITNNKYFFPVRIAEVLNLIANLIINSLLSLYFFNFNILTNVVIINFGLFFIFYSICSMISTSPRTKILLDVFKYKKINKNIYYKKKYNEKTILNNRLKRLLTNKEIIFKNNKIFINKKGLKFYPIVSMIFWLMKKI